MYEIIYYFESLSDGWIGFIGSVLGSFLSGIVAIYVLHKSNKSGNENTEKAIKNNHEIQRRQEKINFCNNLVYLTGEYIQDISGYFYANCDSRLTTEAIENLENQIRNNKIVLSSEMEKIEKLKHKLKTIRVNRDISVKNYFILKMHLQNINAAEKFLEGLDKIHNDMCFKYNEWEEFNEAIENFKLQMTEFVEEYLK